MDPSNIPLPDDLMDEGPSDISDVDDGEFDMAQTGDQTTLKLKRARAPTTTSELNPSLDSTKRGGQRRRVDDQNTAVPPTLHGGALGALNVHGDNVSKSLEGSHHKKMDGIGDQAASTVIVDDDDDMYLPDVQTTQDLLNSIKGLYRILDLVSETGSGGLVDKIVISQQSLGKFIEEVQPGAYASMTKIDFKALDKAHVRPVGVYGSQSQIVDFLEQLNVVDDVTAQALRISENKESTSAAHLRSGLYILHGASTADPADDPVVYVIYWPQKGTWDDDCESSVRRNRVTFMRYLTKICHQIMALISPDHASRIVWNNAQDEEMDASEDEDDDDRLFAFEVSKTKEQDEDVQSRPGFSVCHPSIKEPVDVPEDFDPSLLQTRILHGDTATGFMTVSYVRPTQELKSIRDEMAEANLRSFVTNHSIRLHSQISPDAVTILLDHGLRSRALGHGDQYTHEKDEIIRAARQERDDRKAALAIRLQEDQAIVASIIEQQIKESVMSRFSMLDWKDTTEISEADRAHSENLFTMFPDIKSLVLGISSDTSLFQIGNPQFKMRKERLIIIESVLRHVSGNIHDDKSSRRRLIDTIMDSNTPKDLIQAVRDASVDSSSGFITSVVSFVKGTSDIEARLKNIRSSAQNMDDAKFIAHLSEIVNMEPLLADIAVEISQLASTWLYKAIEKKKSALLTKIQYTRETHLKKAFEHEIDAIQRSALRTAHERFVIATQDIFLRDGVGGVSIIEDISEARSGWGYGSGYYHGGRNSHGGRKYQVTGTLEQQRPPVLRYRLNVLQLTESDKHHLQSDPTFVPLPRVQDASATYFELPVNATVIRFQLLHADNCLLIYDNGHGSTLIYLENIQTLGPALRRGPLSAKKTLHEDKLGGTPSFAYDEPKRMLAVCVKLQLHIFMFDERFTALRGYGSAVNLTAWYESATTIKHMTFAGGSTEELLFIDEHNHARLFSLITGQFRPTSLLMLEAPISVLSSPDDSCFLSIAENDGQWYARAYHWSNFGSTDGVVVDLAQLSGRSASMYGVTSFCNKTSVHCVALDVDTHQIQSIGLSITRKITEFSFKEKGSGRQSDETTAELRTAHNCLINCHEEVWTRFPVVPAVRRRTVTTFAGIKPKVLLFITDRDQPRYKAYWQDMIAQFERRTRKPTEKELVDIHVSSADGGSEDLRNLPSAVSSFLAGEWIVNILCLIPIHIAVARDNRFVPLKDGVFSASLERSLLGAKVEDIINSISFGWYESIFQSYMANKPVRVVSSMGEQSVGKSFALNHFVDTSFAGSAMRTTEGVWMSVNPTEDALIVALDFEGVHSIERSAQEDTLLVLFNTAISNLVLFRNNFALSRDIAGLFQSFQSSSTVLNPASNPSLFNSMLTIIIKDVVDSDKKEITKEFSLKFQQIVQREQEANFISQLHRGRVNIMPWPVIESKSFYTLFGTLKKCLDRERVTHPRAGIFLHTLKTLMAKLKANDWGSMSQNLAAHRAQILTAILPVAVAFGAAEVEPDREPLRNFDDSSIIESRDTEAIFAMPDAAAKVDAGETLTLLQASWQEYADRAVTDEDEWMAGLADHLEDLVNRRLHAVQTWIVANTSRFTEADASITALQRTFNHMSNDIKTSVQLCKLKCNDCHLKCLNVRTHDGPHSCSTDHRCQHTCSYTENHESPVSCGMPAGHPGTHICDVAEHLCGEPCHLSGKGGCMSNCIKVVGHEATDAEHLCQARVHECGEPCGLRDIRLGTTKTYTCPEKCRRPSDEVHDIHSCGTTSCPIQCQLCTRLCSHRDHMHGLEAKSVHLCGQDHACKSLCAAEGVCHIETQPQSVEATFTGRHEQFQYTKYSQAHKRLPCVVSIPIGKLEHVGAHTHKIEKTEKTFHFCKTTCENCGYYCNLPFGHKQKEHKTSHGSMSKTRWAVDGADGEVIELNGRKFSTNDDGAPMLCSMVCQSMGRHAHVDFCRSADPAACSAVGLQHSQTRLVPEPNRPKDWISHKLYWQRSGFEDPYSVDDQGMFEKCDSMCAGPEHQPDAQGNPQPSFCTLPLFHAPHQGAVPLGGGYVSGDGHLFGCRNPAVLQNAFHVIFVIDRSGSMGCSDRKPLQGTPVTQRIAARHNNRLGAVYSALYAFWSARASAQTQAGQAALRRDAYSVIFFDDSVTIPLANNFQSSPDDLLNTVLAQSARGGTDFNTALRNVQNIMETHWSTDRAPIVIFLSDGECGVSDATMQDVCRRALALGGQLSFHTVAFGPGNAVLQRMVQLATEVQNRAPPDPMKPPVPSSYSIAIDSIRLSETFLGIADSLRKPRGALMRG